MSAVKRRVAVDPGKVIRPSPVPAPVRFFDGVAPEAIDEIWAAAKNKRVAAKQTIISAGERSSHLFLVRTGRGRFLRVTKAGDEVLLQLLTPGDTFGIGAMLKNPCTYIGSAEASSDIEVMVWEHSTIRKLAGLYPQLADNALRIVLHYLKQYVNRHVRLATKPAEQRLAETLLNLGHGTGRVTPTGVQVDVTNGQLGALADVSLFTASRLLSGWERKGAVSKQRGSVVIHSPEALIVD